MKRALVIVMVIAACTGSKNGGRPAQTPTVPQILAKLEKARNALTAFRGDSTMDYWLSGQRAKGNVLVMGKVGRMVRFAALSPAGGSTLAEMACDGTNFVYVDYQNNCTLSGPCDAKSVGVFFGIELEPDDFLHLALGTPPVIANPTGTVTWDAAKGGWKVELTGTDGKQTLTISKTDDVLDSELVGTDGKVKWSVSNTGFNTVKGSGALRVPQKSRFKSPAQSQDLLVEWNELEANPTLPPNGFTLQAPTGVPTCGQQAPTKPAPTPTKPAPAKPAPTKPKP